MNLLAIAITAGGAGWFFARGKLSYGVVLSVLCALNIIAVRLGG